MLYMEYYECHSLDDLINMRRAKCVAQLYLTFPVLHELNRPDRTNPSKKITSGQSCISSAQPSYTAMMANILQ